MSSVPRPTRTQRQAALAGEAATDLARFLEDPIMCPQAIVIDLQAEQTTKLSASYLLRLVAEELRRRGNGMED